MTAISTPQTISPAQRSIIPPTAEGRLVVHPDGHEVYYRRYGDAPNTLLALHGGPGGNHGILTALAPLAGDRLQVVLFDQLGGGLSDRPDDPSLFTVTRFVEEVEALRRGLGLERVHLLGRSWGGMLALQYTLDHPEAVSTLVLSNTAPSVLMVCEEMSRLMYGLEPERLRILLKSSASGDFNNQECQEVIRDLYSRHIRRSFPFEAARSRAEFDSATGTTTDEDKGLCHEVMWGNHEFECRGNLIDWDATERLGEIRVPTLIVCGYHDEVGVQANLLMAERIPDNEFVIFGNSSHLITLEKEADAYVGVISNFLARQLGGAPLGV